MNIKNERLSSELYRKSWLLNDVVSGFDAEALRVSPSISNGATAFVPLHLRVALSLVWPLPQKTRWAWYSACGQLAARSC